jgi:hypothetical protein
MDFAAPAIARAARAVADVDVFRRLGRLIECEPGEIVTLAEGVARSVGKTHDPGVEIGPGAFAFLHGLFVGTQLGQASTSSRRRIDEAVDTVAGLGRHAVIAAHCDLGGVAEVARDCAVACGAGPGRTGQKAPCGPRTTMWYEILFEQGLAVSLALFAGSPQAAT